MSLTEQIPSNTKGDPSEHALDNQGSGGAIDAPEPQEVHKGQRLRSQRNQKSKLLDHEPSKNKKNKIRCSRSRVMYHTPIKIYSI